MTHERRLLKQRLLAGHLEEMTSSNCTSMAKPKLMANGEVLTLESLHGLVQQTVFDADSQGTCLPNSGRVTLPKIVLALSGFSLLGSSALSSPLVAPDLSFCTVFYHPKRTSCPEEKDKVSRKSERQFCRVCFTHTFDFGQCCIKVCQDWQNLCACHKS